MKKFGFGKKSSTGDDNDDANRNALFGSRSSKSSAPASSNPYATAAAPQDPYSQDNNKYSGMGKPFSAERGVAQLPPPAEDKARSGGYGGRDAGGSVGSGGGYRDDKYGNAGGYGAADRYGGGVPASAEKYAGSDPKGSASSRYGPGGYGGMGRTASNDTDDNRDALFGGAKDRYQQRSQLPPSNGEPGGGYGAPTSSNYDGYGAPPKQLTAEEEEEEDVAATKQQIRFIKQQDVASTRNALRIANQAEETGRNTLARLGAQGERIHNTEKNLELAANHNREAEAKAKELKTLNRSMFAVHVGNPFTSSSRRQARDDEIRDRHAQERDAREDARAAAFQSQQRVAGAFKGIDQGPAIGAGQGKNLAERSKYQFEADSEDEDMENEIDSNLVALGGAAGRLNALARATGKEVDAQNRHIERIIKTSDKVDDQITMNRARLDRIH
ncbi:MAG: Protein transport protein S9 plasma membrane t-SNARE [Trizodia sp. TS-e1964]|nr:MAG: Protein transport protein S9 plasma membrane t-SNARE [Trizodia sp. TS-e1964]